MHETTLWTSWRTLGSDNGSVFRRPWARHSEPSAQALPAWAPSPRPPAQAGGAELGHASQAARGPCTGFGEQTQGDASLWQPGTQGWRALLCSEREHRLLLSCWATPEDSSLSHAASGTAGQASAAGHSRHVPSPRSSASELQTHSPGPPCGAEDEDAPQRRAGWAAPQPLLPGHGGPQAPKPLPAVSPAEPRPLRPQPLPGRRPRGGRLGRPSPRSSWS